MFNKKQYFNTLLVAAATFFLCFAVTYYSFYVPVPTEKKIEVIENPKSTVEKSIGTQICILPSTRVELVLTNEEAQVIDTIQLKSNSLLGLNKEALEACFIECSVESFSEEEVKLLRVLNEPTTTEASDDTANETYILGVASEHVCIKTLGKPNNMVKLKCKATDFSSYIYSLLLKETICISAEQRALLLEDAGNIQRILQDYIGE